MRFLITLCFRNGTRSHHTVSNQIKAQYGIEYCISCNHPTVFCYNVCYIYLHSSIFNTKFWLLCWFLLGCLALILLSRIGWAGADQRLHQLAQQHPKVTCASADFDHPSEILEKTTGACWLLHVLSIHATNTLRLLTLSCRAA